MANQNDPLYRMLFDYIQQDTKDKDRIKDTLYDLKNQSDRIETQTTKTNGRVTKIEGQIVNLDNVNSERVIVTKVNKKWIAGIVFVGGAIWSAISVVLYSWLEHYFNK